MRHRVLLDTLLTTREQIAMVPWVDAFKEFQRECNGKAVGTNTVEQSNWMSYYKDRGQVINAIGPWHNAQRARAYTSYYTYRRGITRLASECTDLPLVWEPKSAKRSLQAPALEDGEETLWRRLQMYRAEQQALSKRDTLASRPNLVEELKAICQTPWSDPDPIIDAIIDDTSVKVLPPDNVGIQVNLPGGSTNDNTGNTDGGSNDSSNDSSQNEQGEVVVPVTQTLTVDGAVTTVTTTVRVATSVPGSSGSGGASAASTLNSPVFATITALIFTSVWSF